MSWSVPNPDTTCRGDGFVITAVKLRGCQQLREKWSARWCLGVLDASHISQFGLDVQPRPHRVDSFSRRVNEIDTPFDVTIPGRIALGFGMPDLLHLEQCSVATANIVLSELQRRAPPGTFDVASVRLLKYGTVLALTTDAPGDSLDHAPIMNEQPCGSSVPTRCEFSPTTWGKAPVFCVLAVGSAATPSRARRTTAPRTTAPREGLHS